MECDSLLSDFKKNLVNIVLALLVCWSGTLCLSEVALAQRPRFDDFFELIPGTNGQTGQPGRMISQPLQGLGAPPTSLQFPNGNFGGNVLPQGSVLPGGVFQGGTLPNQGGVIGLPNTNAGLPIIRGPVIQGGVLPQGSLPTITAPNFGNSFPGNGGVIAPSFDPYSTPNSAFPVFPRVQNNQQFVPPQTQIQPPPIRTFPNTQPTPFNRNVQGYNYGQPQMPNRWPYQGTGTNWLPAVDWSWAERGWNSFRNNFLPRVLERPRFRETYIFGNNGNELGINDFEVATTATIPRFFGGAEPLRISPGFIGSFWDGPDTAVTGFDLPSKAMSGYLSFDHTTDTSRNFGLDNNLTVGVYSDYDNFSSDSLRVTGRLVTWNRVNEYIVAKFGVEYFDRVRIKMLPVVGLYMTPNPDMKLDLTFPRSKLSHRIPNFNELEAWAYVGAEIGGGSWAIERIGGMNDQVDINDTRAFIGLEWMGPRRVTGFLDIGYVFDREIAYKSDPINELEIQDSVMLRSGLAF